MTYASTSLPWRQGRWSPNRQPMARAASLPNLAAWAPVMLWRLGLKLEPLWAMTWPRVGMKGWQLHLLEQALGHGRHEVVEGGAAASTLTHHRHPAGVATELGDAGLHQLQGQHLRRNTGRCWVVH